MTLEIGQYQAGTRSGDDPSSSIGNLGLSNPSRSDSSPGNTLLVPSNQIRAVLSLPQVALWNSKGERLLEPEEGTAPRSNDKINKAYGCLSDEERLALAHLCTDATTAIKRGDQSPRINLAESMGGPRSSRLAEADRTDLSPEAQAANNAPPPPINSAATGAVSNVKENYSSRGVTIPSLTAFRELVYELNKRG